MSGLHSSSLCVEHDEASAIYANITLAVFFIFSVLQQTHFNWVDQELQQNLIDVLGIVEGTTGEERSFNHVADGEKIVGSVQSFLREPVSRLAECNNPSNKCKDGPQTFL